MRARRPRGRQPLRGWASKRLGTVSIRSEREPPAGRCANRYSRCGFLTRRWPILFGAGQVDLGPAQCARWATCSCSRPRCTPGIPEREARAAAGQPRPGGRLRASVCCAGGASGLLPGGSACALALANRNAMRLPAACEQPR